MRWRRVPGVTDKNERKLSYNITSIKENNKLHAKVKGIRSPQFEGDAQETKDDWASSLEDYQVTF